MIAVCDLCIGNWVYDGERTQFPMYVQTIGEDYVYLNFEGNEGDVFESAPGELHGIPLTKELLRKMGFKYSKDDSKEMAVYALRIKVSKERYIRILVCPECGCVTLYDITDKGEFGTRWYHNTIHQKYLHELQNFVYMTTKQQLKIEL